MTTVSLNALGPVRAAEVDLMARNEAGARHSAARTATVEVVRPVDPLTRRRDEAAWVDAAPATERIRLDIRV